MSSSVTAAFQCHWCPGLDRCSDGLDRNRQEWLESKCDISVCLYMSIMREVLGGSYNTVQLHLCNIVHHRTCFVMIWILMWCSWGFCECWSCIQRGTAGCYSNVQLHYKSAFSLRSLCLCIYCLTDNAPSCLKGLWISIFISWSQISAFCGWSTYLDFHNTAQKCCCGWPFLLEQAA